jgi:Siphovirus-type tail component, C-terminal domain
MLTSVTLDDFYIHGGSNGVALTTFDLGSPSPRSIIDTRPGQHGATDATRYYGPRLIALGGRVVASTAASLWSNFDDLKGALVAGSTHTLKIVRDGTGIAERCQVRVDGALESPVVAGTVGPIMRFGVTLLAPDPRWYSDTLSQGSYDPTDSGTGGLTFDLDFELTFNVSSGATLTTDNQGTISTPPYFTVTGPVVNPKITNETTGESIYTTGLALSTGATVEIDVANRRCLLGGTTSRPDLIDSSLTEWFELQPGINQLRMTGSGMSASATNLAVSYRSARI